MTNTVTISSDDLDSNSVPDDVDALARVAQAEAGDVFTYYKNQGFSDADAAKYSYGMVIDTIINRVAALKIPSFLKTCGKSIAYAVMKFRSTN